MSAKVVADDWRAPMTQPARMCGRVPGSTSWLRATYIGRQVEFVTHHPSASLTPSLPVARRSGEHNDITGLFQPPASCTLLRSVQPRVTLVAHTCRTSGGDSRACRSGYTSNRVRLLNAPSVGQAGCTSGQWESRESGRRAAHLDFRHLNVRHRFSAPCSVVFTSSSLTSLAGLMNAEPASQPPTMLLSHTGYAVLV